MENERMTRYAFDQRIMYLIRSFYDPDDYDSDLLEWKKHDSKQRIKEALYLAEDIGLIDFKDYDICLAIVAYMGTDIPMEDRTW